MDNVAQSSSKSSSNLGLTVLIVFLCIVLGFLGWSAWNVYAPKSSVISVPQHEKSVGTGENVSFPVVGAQQPSTVGGIDQPTAVPTVNKGTGKFACDKEGNCNLFDDKGRAGCPVTYADPACLNACGEVKNRCPI